MATATETSQAAQATTPPAAHTEADELDAIFRQVMTCEPLLADGEVDTFLDAMYGKGAQQRRRAVAAFATKGGDFYKGVSENREQAVVVAMVALMARDDAKMFRGVAEMLEALDTRTEVALCNHEDMDAIKAEAAAMLDDD